VHDKGGVVGDTSTSNAGRTNRGQVVGGIVFTGVQAKSEEGATGSEEGGKRERPRSRGKERKNFQEGRGTRN
jgi:hypothetical protein